MIKNSQQTKNRIPPQSDKKYEQKKPITEL